MRFLLFAILSFVLTVPARAITGSYDYSDSAGAVNAGQIATNVSNIATNASDIDAVELEVDSLFAGGATTYVEITGDTMTGSLTLAGLFVDTVTARGATGLYLHEDGGAGIFIKNGGDVGIGNDAPNEKLDVTGTIEGHDFISSLANPIYLLEDITAGDDDFRMAANGDVLSIEQNVGDATWTEYFRLTGGAFNWGTAVYKSTLSALGELAIPGTLDCATINTGLGDFEIGQDLDTGDSVTFAGVTANLTGNVTGSSLTAVDASGAWVCDDGGNCLHVEDGGNVGIGTTDPTDVLEVNSGSTNGGLLIKSLTDNAILEINAPADETTAISFNVAGITKFNMYRGAGSDNVNLKIGTDVALTLKLGGNVGIANTNPSTLFEVGDGTFNVTIGGNVGIGVTDPDEALEVNGNIHVSGRIYGSLGYFAETREVLKSVDETDTQDTLQPDDELLFTGILADTTQHFHIEVYGLQGTHAAAEFDYALDFTNDAEIMLNCVEYGTGITATHYLQQVDADERTINTASDGDFFFSCDGNVYFPTTGTFSLMWSQNTNQSVDTTVLAKSHVEMHQEY